VKFCRKNRRKNK